MQNSVLSTRITSLYGSQPSSVVFACKTETLGPELQVSMGPRPHLSFCAYKTACRISSLYGSQPSFVVLCIQNSDFLTRITSLYGSQTSPVVLCMQNSKLSFRITSLYGSQPSSVVFACKLANLGPELQVSMDPSPHLWFLHGKQRL